MNQREATVYEFGPYRLETRHRLLFRGSDIVPIGNKPFIILKLLVENAGELVEKEEILNRVWPHQEIEENIVTQHIYNLRRALIDDSKAQSYIQTIPGRGYIFVQSVRRTAVGKSDVTNQAEDVTTEYSSLSEIKKRDHPAPERATSRVGWQKIAITALICFIVLLAGIAIFRSANVSSLGQRDIANRSELPRAIPFVTLPGQESHPAFSPDGKRLAFTSEGETRDNQDIYVKEIRGGNLIRITTNPDNDHNVTWSPDGKWLAFLRKPAKFSPYKVIIVPANGGNERVIGQSWGGLDWSHDGSLLATSDYDGLGTPTGIYLIPVNGGTKRKLTTPPQNVYDTFPEFSPDGKYIAFVRWISNTNSDLFILTLADGTIRQITFDRMRIPDLHWSESGSEIYFVSDRQTGNRLWRLPMNGGIPTPLTRVPIDIETFSISSDGHTLAFTQLLNDTVIELNEIGRSTGSEILQSNPTCSINSSRSDDTPRFSPDGSMIAFTSDRSGTEEIWVAKANCTNPLQVTHFNQIGVGSPRWSPDGRVIVFDRNTDIGPDVYTINIDGTNLKRLTNNPGNNNMPAWSNDGKWIYYTSSITNVKQIFKVPATGGDSIPVTSGQGHEPVESTDGSILYYNHADTLWQKDLKSGKESPVPELANVPIGRYWELSGDSIYFIQQVTGVNPTVIRFDLKRRVQQPILQIRGFLAKWVPGLSYDPINRRLAVSYVSYRLGDITLLENWH